MFALDYGRRCIIFHYIVESHVSSTFFCTAMICRIDGSAYVYGAVALRPATPALLPKMIG